MALHQFSATRAMAAAKARFALAYRSDRRYTMYGKRQAHPMTAYSASRNRSIFAEFIVGVSLGVVDKPRIEIVQGQGQKFTKHRHGGAPYGCSQTGFL